MLLDIQQYELGNKITKADAKIENTFTCFTGTQTCVFANDGAVNCCDLVTDAAGSSFYVACEFFTSCVNWLDLSSCSGDCLTAEDVRRW